MTDKSYTIVGLHATNLLKLKAVSLRPDPEHSVIRVTGRNEQGKTSLLNSIVYAIAGGRSLPLEPIRDGEDSARVQVDLGELIIERRWTKSGTYLEVSDRDGRKYKSPQALLDKFFTTVSFDPLLFDRMKPREQIDELLRVSGESLRESIDQLDGERESLYSKRTEVNRDLKSSQSQLDGIPSIPEGTPSEIVSPDDLMAELDAATEMQRKAESEVNAADALLCDLRRSENTIEDDKKHLARLEDEIQRVKDSLEAQRKHADTLNDKLKEKRKSAEKLAAAVPDISEIKSRISSVDETNSFVRLAKKRKQLSRDAEILSKQADELSAKIEEVDNSKRDLLSGATEGIHPNLAIEDGQIMLKGFPLSQASQAQRIKLGLAVAMAGNPTLRVLRITDGSALDSSAIALIAEIAKKEGYQVWIEQMDETGKVGVVIEDGEVVNAPEGYQAMEEK